MTHTGNKLGANLRHSHYDQTLVYLVNSVLYGRDSTDIDTDGRDHPMQVCDVVYDTHVLTYGTWLNKFTCDHVITSIQLPDKTFTRGDVAQ